MVSLNMINNLPVTFRNILNANNIFGPDVPSMKVKSVRRRPEAVVSNYVEISKEILDMNTNLEVSVDVMFINKLTFLVSTSKRLNFTTVEYIPNRSEKELARSVNKNQMSIKNEASQYVLCVWTLSLTVQTR